MKRFMLSVVFVMGLITATFANEKEVALKLEDNKLHYNYYSKAGFKGIRLDKASQLIIKTDNGIQLTLPVDQDILSHKGYNSESLSVSVDLQSCKVELLSKRSVVEVVLRHANGNEYHFLRN